MSELATEQLGANMGTLQINGKEYPLASARTELLERIKQNAIIWGDVVLSSGAKAKYYVDLRRITLHHHTSPLVGALLRAALADIEFDSVGGLTMGADPIATAIMHSHGRPVNAFVVRKEAKTHGLARRIEGPAIAGKRVVIVEDSSTTGSSALAAAKAAVEAGATVVCIAAIVDRDTGAARAIQEAGYDYRYLFGLEDLGLAKQI